MARYIRFWNVENLTPTPPDVIHFFLTFRLQKRLIKRYFSPLNLLLEVPHGEKPQNVPTLLLTVCYCCQELRFSLPTSLNHLKIVMEIRNLMLAK